MLGDAEYMMSNYQNLTYLNDGRDRYCPVCGCPNDNYMPPLRNVKPPKSKEQEDKEWNRCCMLMFVVFLILCILGKAMQ